MHAVHSTRVTTGRFLNRMRRFTPHGFYWLLIVSLVLSSLAPALAEDGSPSKNENSPAPSALTSLSPPAEPSAEAKAAITFIENQDAIVEQVFDLVEKLEVKTIEMRQSLGNEKYETMVEQGKSKDILGIQVPGLGKAEPTTVKPTPEEKGVIITRVVHEATGIAFIIIDNRISLDSAHLRQLIARQHLDANNSKGRPVLLIQIDSQELAEPGAPSVRAQSKDYDVTYRPKPTSLAAKWREWREATWVNPSKWDFALSQFCAAGQIGITCAMGELQKIADPSHAKPYLNTALLSYVFATAVGTFSSTWRNWRPRLMPIPAMPLRQLRFQLFGV